MNIYVFNRRVPPDKLRAWKKSRETELPNPCAGYEEGRGQMYASGPFSKKYLDGLLADYWAPTPDIKPEDIVEP